MQTGGTNRAVFLDRDGVLVRDRGPLVDAADIDLVQNVSQALSDLKGAGFLLIGVSNQTAIARGLLKEDGVRKLEATVEQRIAEGGGPRLDGFYFCPHHPEATVHTYRRNCDCRKPGDGLLRTASAEHDIDLADSFMVGDRPSDIAAGASAGCRTVWLQSGRHDDPPIVTAEGFEAPEPDHACTELLAAVKWILQEAS